MAALVGTVQNIFFLFIKPTMHIIFKVYVLNMRSELSGEILFKLSNTPLVLWPPPLVLGRLHWYGGVTVLLPGQVIWK